MNWRRGWNLIALAVLLLGLVPVMAMAAPRPDWSKVDPLLLDRLAVEEETPFFVIMAVQADVSGAAALSTKVEKTTYVYEQLTRTARQTQASLLAYLKERGVPFQAFYIMNTIRVEAGLPVIEWLAAREDVARISVPPNPRLEPVYDERPAGEGTAAPEWNVLRVGAPDVWAMGFRGEGMVVGDNDTGMQYDHPALVNQYRGNLGGGVFDHNYNWWDDIGGSSTPLDYDSHGTHTAGTMVGDDGGSNQIGVAPGAKIIACAGLSLTCLEFFLTPWDLNHQNPDPTKAPDAINNSWYDPDPFDYRPIIQNLNAAGIAVIKSAGNAGGNCNTITNPGYVPEIIATAAFANGDTIAGFSSRGPSSYYNPPGTILKPEVAAPGVSVRSSVPTNGYGYKSGTSMAAPHSTALVALIWNAAPCLRGDVPTTKDIMMHSAEAKIDPQCPPFIDHPNDVWGWGILDMPAAVQAAIAYCSDSGALDGHVYDAGTMAPIEGATVTAYHEGGWQNSVDTNAAGYYTMTALVGTYTVTAAHPWYTTGMTTGIYVATDTVTTVDFELVQQSYDVTGQVTHEYYGTPIAEAAVMAGPAGDATTTDPNGYYTLTLAAGTYHFTATKAGYTTVVLPDVPITGTTVIDFELNSPVVVVAPDSLHAVVYSSDTATMTMNIDNPGGLDLSFAIAETTASLRLVDQDVTVRVPARAARPEAASRGPAQARPARTFRMHIDWISAEPIDVLIVTPDVVGGGDISLLLSTLAAFPDLVVTLWDGNAGTPTVVDMQAYDVVFVGNDVLWTSSAIDKVALSNNLADYMDAGGKVLVGSFVWSFDDWGFGPAGRFISDDYSPYEMATGDIWDPTVLGSYDPLHPIMAGVVTATEGYNHQDQVLSPNGTWVASWIDGENYVAVSPGCVGLNSLFFHQADFGGQAGEILHNALLWLAAVPEVDVPWVSEVPVSGTVPAGTDLDVDVVFTALAPYHVAGDYTATLIIGHNDPEVAGDVLVPITMTVFDCITVTEADFSWLPLVPFAGEDVTFTGTAGGDAPITFTWDLGDGTMAEGMTVTHAYTAAGSYTVTMIAANACPSAMTVTHALTVAVSPCDPVQIITVTSEITSCVVTFSAEITGTAPITWVWDFGPFGTSTETNPVVDFGATGVYTGTLEAWNCEQGYDSYSFTVDVACPQQYTIYLPLVFKGYAP